MEETLRFRSPFNNIFRLLKEDTDILGVPMKAGQMVVAWSQSANRDPQQFPDPDTFDVHRSANRHGLRPGIHHCLGAFLARMEAKVFLDLVFDTSPPSPSTTTGRSHQNDSSSAVICRHRRPRLSAGPHPGSRS